MRRLPHLADFETDVLDSYRAWRIQEVKCSGKTKITMVIRRMLVRIGGRERTAVRRMQAELRWRKTVKD
jgi:hypothetical protein